ncbi:unnamed protein product [Brassica rapa subsp. trilocularis]
MNNSLEEVKRLMENMISTLKSKEDSGDAVKIEDSKAEEMNIADDEEDMFPRTRGRLVNSHLFLLDLNFFLKLECVVIATRLLRDVYRWCFRTEVVLFLSGVCELPVARRQVCFTYLLYLSVSSV